MNRMQFAQWLLSVQYKKGWYLQFGYRDDTPWFQWWFNGPCSVTGEVKAWPCRVWTIRHPHLTTEAQLVYLVWTAALAAEEHECREFFKYKDVVVYDPHGDRRNRV